MDIGEVEGEAEVSDDRDDRWVERHKEAVKRREVDTSKRTREAALESAAIGKARETRSRQPAG